MPIVYDVKVKASLIINLKVITESEETLNSDIEKMLKEKGYESFEIVEKKLGKLEWNTALDVK